MRTYPETHQQGDISIENMALLIPQNPHWRKDMNSMHIQGDLGIQVAEDGRVWVCINGVAFIRFKPTKGRTQE